MDFSNWLSNLNANEAIIVPLAAMILTIAAFCLINHCWPCSPSPTSETEEDDCHDLDDIVEKYWTPDVVSIDYGLKSLTLTKMNPTIAKTSESEVSVVKK